MIELWQEYGAAFLWHDGRRFSGVAMTLWLLTSSLVLSLAMSLPLAVARCSPRRWLRWPVAAYTYVFRGTPLYVQLLIVYVGLFSLQFVREHALLSSFFREGINCAIFAFALNTCAYTTEVFAGAIRSVPANEVEAARAYGMSSWQTYWRLILPSALRRALPAYSNEVILVLHTTSIAFTATVPDILKVARDANAATYRTFEAFGTAALLYALIVFVLIGLFRLAERRWLAFLQPRGH